MELITILTTCRRFKGFVYQHARFGPDKKSIEVSVRPRKGSAAICSRCHQPAPGYDQLAERRFEFIPLWGFLVFLLYTMRRVNCRRCGVVIVEEVPWGDGKRTLTKAYMLFLARWARRPSWKETAEAFRTSWEKVFNAPEGFSMIPLVQTVFFLVVHLRDQCRLAQLWKWRKFLEFSHNQPLKPLPFVSRLKLWRQQHPCTAGGWNPAVIDGHGCGTRCA